MERYGLGYLEDKFYKDAQQAMNHPFKDEFNLSLAFLTLVEEIIKLREEIEELKVLNNVRD